MSDGIERTTMLSGRNNVIWVDSKGKQDNRRKFIREYAIAYPKVGISMSRRYSGLILGAYFIIMLFSAALFGDTLFTAVLSNAAMVMIVAYAADTIVTGINIIRFNDRQLKNGGETVDPWNKRIIRTSRIAMIYVKPALTVTLTAALIVSFYVDTVRQIALRGFPLFYWALILFCILMNVYPAERVCPIIFFGAESGVVFGGALFSYDTLSDVNFSNNGEFMLYCKEQTVAKGLMLSDDRYHFQVMLNSDSRT